MLEKPVRTPTRLTGPGRSVPEPFQIDLLKDGLVMAGQKIGDRELSRL
jgi:hypothetical protein